MSKLTPEEQEQVERRAFLAAHDALKNYDEQTQSRKTKVRQVLQAFAAVEQIAKEAGKQYGGYVHIDAHPIVASVIICGKDPQFENAATHSAGGEMLIIFACACILLQASYEFDGALECDPYGEGYCDQALKAFVVDDADDDTVETIK